MLFNYEFTFTEPSGRLIFVPTDNSRIFGRKLHDRILRRWKVPQYFYHFQDGGHVAAAQVHLANQFFVRLDLQRFYDSVTRTRVHRSLTAIGFGRKYAWDAACQSTVSKTKKGRRYSLPFGFVQSPILSTIALSTSALGTALLKLHSSDSVNLSVYMDDIILSSDDQVSLITAKTELETAAASAGFQFNTSKSFGPAATLEVFNLELSRGTLAVTSSRLAEFATAIRLGDASTTAGILSYVGSVNTDQRAMLANL